MNNELQARVRKQVADENVRHIQLWFTDILGSLKMVEIPESQLDSVMENGAAFDGSSITGYAEIEESDIVAMPDWETFRVLPWSQNQERTAFVFCNILNRELRALRGRPPLDPADGSSSAPPTWGSTSTWGPSSSTSTSRAPRSPRSSTRAATSTCCRPTSGNDLRKQTVRTLEKLGIVMEASHHEVAPSQHELDPHYDEALKMADQVMIMRLITKEVAAHNGVYATFMPKPLHGENGSGMHTHQSLFRGDDATPCSRTRTPTTSRPWRAASSPGSSSTWARSARCSTSG